MEKSLLILELVRIAQLERDQLKASAESVASGATSSEAKQEGKYDTRALLDSYLAGAQDARVRELDAQIDLIQRFQVQDISSDESIAVGALVELKLAQKSQKIWYFLLPSLGGYKLHWQQKIIQTVSVATPLGQSVLGLFVGDKFETPLGEGQILNLL